MSYRRPIREGEAPIITVDRSANNLGYQKRCSRTPKAEPKSLGWDLDRIPARADTWFEHWLHISCVKSLHGGVLGRGVGGARTRHERGNGGVHGVSFYLAVRFLAQVSGGDLWGWAVTLPGGRRVPDGYPRGVFAGGHYAVPSQVSIFLTYCHGGLSVKKSMAAPVLSATNSYRVLLSSLSNTSPS